MPSRALKVLSVSDRIDSNLLERDTYEKYKDVDLILSCGDLPYYHIEKLFQLYEVPVLYVRGCAKNPNLKKRHTALVDRLRISV